MESTNTNGIPASLLVDSSMLFIAGSCLLDRKIPVEFRRGGVLWTVPAGQLLHPSEWGTITSHFVPFLKSARKWK